MQSEQIKYVAALGFFDGVHLGHQAIMRLAVKRASEINALSCAFTFDIKPSSFFSKQTENLIVPDMSERERLIKHYGGVEQVVFLKFDDTMAGMEYDQFISEILVKQHNVCHLVMGENYTCGKGKKGDIVAILALCIKLGIGCDVIPLLNMNGEKISSSRIRQAIAINDTESANELLGHRI